MQNDPWEKEIKSGVRCMGYLLNIDAARVWLPRPARSARGVAGEVCRVEEGPEVEVYVQKVSEEEAAVMFDAGGRHADVQGGP